MRTAIDHTGKRYGSWLVLHLGARICGRQKTWVCRCDCGTVKEVFRVLLVSGDSRSCGCRRIKHGLTNTPEHKAWSMLRARCRNKRSRCYPDYGGRGIKVCPEWDDFNCFLADMGARPSRKHSIDRIDVNGNYEPSNCRWATQIEQANNKRSTRYYVIRGERMTNTQAARRYGQNSNTVSWRMAKRGQTIEQALKLEPVS